MTGAAIIVLGPGGMETARRVQVAVAGSEIHGLAQRVPDAENTFDDTGAHLRALFAAGTPIVGICAAGILIRLLAPALADRLVDDEVDVALLVPA